MGSAILEGLLQNSPAEGTPRLSYTAHVNSSTSLTRLQESFSSNSTNITFTSGPENLIQTVTSSDIILLGFLPTQLLQILTSTPDLATHLKGKTIISMLAGISTSQLLDALVSHCPGSAPSDFSLARIIPTLSAKICSSVTLLAEPCSPVARTAVEKIFSRVGSLHPIPEKLMDTATAIGAAMHALAIVAVDSATDCSVAEGMMAVPHCLPHPLLPLLQLLTMKYRSPPRNSPIPHSLLLEILHCTHDDRVIRRR